MDDEFWWPHPLPKPIVERLELLDENETEFAKTVMAAVLMQRYERMVMAHGFDSFTVDALMLMHARWLTGATFSELQQSLCTVEKEQVLAEVEQAGQ